MVMHNQFMSSNEVRMKLYDSHACKVSEGEFMLAIGDSKSNDRKDFWYTKVTSDREWSNCSVWKWSNNILRVKKLSAGNSRQCLIINGILFLIGLPISLGAVVYATGWHG